MIHGKRNTAPVVLGRIGECSKRTIVNHKEGRRRSSEEQCTQVGSQKDEGGRNIAYSARQQVDECSKER